MFLRFALDGDKRRLVSLWSVCFPGDEDFCNYFMSDIFDPNNTFVIEDGGKVVSMAFMLPMTLLYRSSRVPAAYIFAVGTDPDYRGRGFAAELLERIFTEMKKREIPLAFLVPQKDGLFDYYKRFGFAEVFSLCHERLAREMLEPDAAAGYTLEQSGVPNGRSLADADIEAADRLFEKVMKYRDHLTRTPEHWKKAIRIGEIAGGGMITIKTEGHLAGYALCEWVGDDLLINELLAEDEASYNALRAGVLDRMGASEATMLEAACPHDAVRFGMARAVDTEKMLGYAAEYRRDMECAFAVLDTMAPWNNGQYAIHGKSVTRTDTQESRAHITPGQLTDILFSAGPVPCVNLLFS